jgi:uncharacterized protein (TIGR03118 family)
MPHKKKFNKLYKSKIYKLVSNIASIPAETTDTNLINPWGIALDKHNDLVWIADNGTGLITQYTKSGSNTNVVVTVPNISGLGPANPTGLVLNTNSGFVIMLAGKSASATIIIATESGTIAGFNKMVDPLNAIIMYDGSSTGTVYKGLAQNDDLLYATDFFNNKIDVFDFNYNLQTGYGFIDPNLQAGFAPFNIVSIDKKLFVSYAKQKPPNNTDDLIGTGNGYINVFQYDGTFIKRLVSNGFLNSPWGMVGFIPKQLSISVSSTTSDSASVSSISLDNIRCVETKKLLVGNFGNGMVNAFDIETGQFAGYLTTRHKRSLVIDGLWGLVAECNDKNDDTIFYTSGPNYEKNGLFGKLVIDNC